LATNSERPRRFDLRTTIPLAAETLVSLARKPQRSWVVPGLTLITGIAFGILMLELLFFPGPITALAFEGELRSRLSANYGVDPVAARLHELRLTIVEDVLGMNGGDGTGPSVLAMLFQDPVPTVTPKAIRPTSPAEEPSASPVPTDVPTAVATGTAEISPSSTPLPATEVAAAAYCEKLSITEMWVYSDDEVRAKVKNSGSHHAYLTGTNFEWPDVPGPTYIDWFKFDDKKYFSLDDWTSPTTSSGSDVRVKKGHTETWRVDFDDKPDEGIYGFFAVRLTFDVSGLATCYLNASTFVDIPATPAPSPGPTDPPAPTNTVEPTETSAATPTPDATLTAVATAGTSTPEPTQTPDN